LQASMLVQLVFPLLDDPVRSVRIEAARVLAPVPVGQLQGEQLAVYKKATDEYIQSQTANAERPEAKLNLGNYYIARGDIDKAEAACPKIALQINHAFGTDVDKDIVRRILAKHYKPNPNDGNGPSWLTFIGHMKDSLWSVDLFRCESISLKSHWVMIILDQHSRRIIGFSVKSGSVDGAALCYLFNQIIFNLIRRLRSL
ncbi:MAG: tetratricopeptide repeat protein, partial [Gammaproteobacteria bacterium]|nr:tetratricopeptide repeat protein [Gammaproteobacteria bacterium]